MEKDEKHLITLVDGSLAKFSSAQVLLNTRKAMCN